MDNGFVLNNREILNAIYVMYDIAVIWNALLNTYCIRAERNLIWIMPCVMSERWLTEPLTPAILGKISHLLQQIVIIMQDWTSLLELRNGILWIEGFRSLHYKSHKSHYSRGVVRAEQNNQENSEHDPRALILPSYLSIINQVLELYLPRDRKRQSDRWRHPTRCRKASLKVL